MGSTCSNTATRLQHGACTIVAKLIREYYTLSIAPRYIYTPASYWYISYPILIMPQALPFFFLNQATFVLASLAVLVYVTSVYLLPPFLHMLVSRVYITKL